MAIICEVRARFASQITGMRDVYLQIVDMMLHGVPLLQATIGGLAIVKFFHILANNFIFASCKYDLPRSSEQLAQIPIFAGIWLHCGLSDELRLRCDLAEASSLHFGNLPNRVCTVTYVIRLSEGFCDRFDNTESA